MPATTLVNCTVTNGPHAAALIDSIRNAIYAANTGQFGVTHYLCDWPHDPPVPGEHFHIEAELHSANSVPVLPDSQSREALLS